MNALYVTGRRLTVAVGICAMALCFGGSAAAQGPGGGPGGGREGGPGRGGPRGPQMSMEDVVKAVKIEAATVAALVGIDASKVQDIAVAYGDARSSFHQGMPARGEGGRGDFQGMRDHAAAERSKLETALAVIVGGDQAAAATAYLGTFDRRWDQMVIVLDGLGLDSAAAEQANGIVANHVKALAAQRDAAIASGDFQSMRETMMAANEALNSDLSAVLSVEQMAQWKQATSRGDRGGRGPGGPGGEGRGGEGRGPRGEGGQRPPRN